MPGIVVQVSGPDGVRHGGRTHRQAGMAGIGLLDRIGGEKSQRIDGALLEIVVRHRKPFCESVGARE
jgi:hypothetical protein